MSTQEIVKALISPAEKLIDAVRSAIGKAYEPRYLRRMADAEAHRINVVGNALLDRVEIPAVFNNGNLEMDTTDFEGLIKRAKQRLALQELSKQNNIESVVDQAYAMLEGEEPIPDEPIDSDWINRFFSSVQEISSEQMQLIWSRILAGEVKKPGSFSLRTLDTLRNINQKEAEMFVQIAPFLVSSESALVLSSDKALLAKYGIPYGMIVALDECGLINSSSFLSLDIQLSEQNETTIYTRERIARIKPINNENVNIKFGVYLLTTAGKELSKIIDTQPNNDYFHDLIIKIDSENRNKAVSSIHRVNYIKDNNINYALEPIETIGNAS